MRELCGKNAWDISDFMRAPSHLCHHREVAHGVLTLTAGLAHRNHSEEYSAMLDIKASFGFCDYIKWELEFWKTLPYVFCLPTNKGFIPYKLMSDASRGYISINLQILIESH